MSQSNYSYDSRYLFTASIRRDYPANELVNAYGNFPSFALGWNVNNESFFNVDLINRMKVRGELGIIGNEIDGSRQYSLIVLGVNGVFGENEGWQCRATFQGGGNPNLKWEETTQTNIGIDIGMDDKLIAEASITM
ncbi:MAG: TonB-dependent receptor [Saprospiraceae bacterium]